ncbi:MAG: hypothetical protein RLY93_03215 [Sumerlaeia bacterium]
MKKPPSVSQRPTSLWVLALVSIFLAATIWIIVKQQETETRTFRIPVEIENVPAVVELQSRFDPAPIEARFTFPKTRERDADETNFRVVVDAKFLKDRFRPGDFTTITEQIQPSQIVTPEDFRFLEFLPGSSTIELSGRLRTAMGSVQPTIVGEPAEGFFVDRERILIEPRQIEVAVSQPVFLESQEKGLTLPTVPIPVGGQSGVVSGNYELDWNLMPGVERIPRREYSAVEIIVPLPERTITRTFEEVPMTYDPVRADIYAVVEPSVLGVKVTGPQSLLNRLTPGMLNLETRRFIDETPGNKVETLVEVRFETENPAMNRRIEDEVRVELDQNTVTIQLFSLDETEPEDDAGETTGTLQATPTAGP